MLKRTPFEDRFWSRVFPVPMSGCWIWMGALDKFGYGHICLGGASSAPIPAHRASMIIAGHDLRDAFVLHRCDIPSCVNPDHLFLGTQLDNIRDMIAKGRRGDCGSRKQTHCKRGHPLDGDDVRHRRGERECMQCVRITRAAREAKK